MKALSVGLIDERSIQTPLFRAMSSSVRSRWVTKPRANKVKLKSFSNHRVQN